MCYIIIIYIFFWGGGAQLSLNLCPNYMSKGAKFLNTDMVGPNNVTRLFLIAHYLLSNVSRNVTPIPLFLKLKTFFQIKKLYFLCSVLL
jgi:hypothetical protein